MTRGTGRKMRPVLGRSRLGPIVRSLMRTGIWIAIQEARQMNDEARHLAQGFSSAHESDPVPLLEAKGTRWGLFLSVESSPH
jgi:hypothetical protein